MEVKEENPHERLKQKLSELEKVWTAMKEGKSSSAVSCITVEEALELVENSPRKLMISLQHDQDDPEAEMRSPYRRKLFHDSDDDETRTTRLSHSTCWSSNVMRAGDNNNKINKKHEKKKKKKKKKNRGSIVCVCVIVLLLWVLVVLLINGFDQLSMNREIYNLVPT